MENQFNYLYALQNGRFFRSRLQWSATYVYPGVVSFGTYHSVIMAIYQLLANQSTPKSLAYRKFYLHF